jgi:sugar phosphate isomerase/epimerase
MKSSITISLVPETRSGPFVFHDGLEAGFADAARLGFDAVEIFPPSAEALDVAAIRDLSDRHGLPVAAVGTGAGWVRHKLSLVDPDPAVRSAAVDFISRIVEVAGELGAPAILGSMQGRHDDATPRERALEWLGEALESIGERAGAHGQPFLYEFLNRYETNLFNRTGDALGFIKSLRTAHLKLLCDLFHMNIEEANPAQALRHAGYDVGHVHFADSNRRAAGMGHTDMIPIIAALRDIGYAGYLSAEIFPLPDSITAAEQTIRSFRELTAPNG